MLKSYSGDYRAKYMKKKIEGVVDLEEELVSALEELGKYKRL